MDQLLVVVNNFIAQVPRPLGIMALPLGILLLFRLNEARAFKKARVPRRRF